MQKHSYTPIELMDFIGNWQKACLALKKLINHKAEWEDVQDQDGIYLPIFNNLKVLCRNWIFDMSANALSRVDTKLE